jgi:SET domain-containing protein
LTLDEYLERYHRESAPYTAKLYRQNNVQMYEDASLQRGIGSLINHSGVRANCRMSIGCDNKILFVATKIIRNNTEILVSYGRSYRFNVAHTRSATNNKRLSI